MDTRNISVEEAAALRKERARNDAAVMSNDTKARMASQWARGGARERGERMDGCATTHLAAWGPAAEQVFLAPVPRAPGMRTSTLLLLMVGGSVMRGCLHMLSSPPPSTSVFTAYSVFTTRSNSVNTRVNTPFL